MGNLLLHISSATGGGTEGLLPEQSHSVSKRTTTAPSKAEGLKQPGLCWPMIVEKPPCPRKPKAFLRSVVRQLRNSHAVLRCCCLASVADACQFCKQQQFPCYMVCQWSSFLAVFKLLLPSLSVPRMRGIEPVV